MYWEVSKKENVFFVVGGGGLKNLKLWYWFLVRVFFLSDFIVEGRRCRVWGREMDKIYGFEFFYNRYKFGYESGIFMI